jgi:hypothetical protein
MFPLFFEEEMTTKSVTYLPLAWWVNMQEYHLQNAQSNAVSKNQWPSYVPQMHEGFGGVGLH